MQYISPLQHMDSTGKSCGTVAVLAPRRSYGFGVCSHPLRIIARFFLRVSALRDSFLLEPLARLGFRALFGHASRISGRQGSGGVPAHRCDRWAVEKTVGAAAASGPGWPTCHCAREAVLGLKHQ